MRTENEIILFFRPQEMWPTAAASVALALAAAAAAAAAAEYGGGGAAGNGTVAIGAHLREQNTFVDF